MTIETHRGDCVELIASLDAASVDCIITDIPYGIDYKSGRQSIDRLRSNARLGDVEIREQYFGEIANDGALPTEWLQGAHRVLREGCAMYIYAHWKKWGELQCAVSAAGFDVKNMIVLNKSNHGMGDLKGSFSPKHELLMLATKGRHLLRFPNGRKSDVWDVPVKFSGARRLHPNEKPVSWAYPAIENSTDERQTVLDPFMGSAFVGEACMRMGRNFIGYEIDEVYYRVAQVRLDSLITHDPAVSMRDAGMTLPAIARELRRTVPEVARMLRGAV